MFNSWKKPQLKFPNGLAPWDEVKDYFDQLDEFYAQRKIRGWLRSKTICGMNGLAAICHPFKTIRSQYRFLRNDRKNKKGRIKVNFGTSDIWEFSYVNAKAQIAALTSLKEISHGFPGSLYLDLGYDYLKITKEQSDECFALWETILSTMIDGWQSVLDRQNFDFNGDLNAHIAACDERFETGMKLYVKYYHDLWD